MNAFFLPDVTNKATQWNKTSNIVYLNQVKPRLYNV